MTHETPLTPEHCYDCGASEYFANNCTVPKVREIEIEHEDSSPNAERLYRPKSDGKQRRLGNLSLLG
jgi:hypothetical protein